MLEKILFTLAEEVKANRRAALAILTNTEGSTPGRNGDFLAVLEDGQVLGTMGGGAFEGTIIEKAKECMTYLKDEKFEYKLNKEGPLGMECGGSAEVYIRVFKPSNRLIIVGGGHIALELYKFGELLSFHTTIFEDREEYGNEDRFPKAEIKLGNYEDTLKGYEFDENCYVVIVTRGHDFDELALKTVIQSKAAYIGMVGSKGKVQFIMDNLRNEGISEENIARVYAPIGVKTGGETPTEIAFSIMAEIEIVKNSGKLIHMREYKK